MLVDTSVWIDHLRHADRVLQDALEAGHVLTHPFVIGELALGGIHARRRKPFLQSLYDLPQADPATDDEVLRFIERQAMPGRGIGYVDAHLLASARISAARLWTRDKRLHAVAQELRIAA